MDTCDTAVQVHSVLWCARVQHVPVPVVPVLEASWVNPYLCGNLATRKGMQSWTVGKKGERRKSRDCEGRGLRRVRSQVVILQRLKTESGWLPWMTLAMCKLNTYQVCRRLCILCFRCGIIIGYRFIVDIGVKKRVKGVNRALQVHT